MAGKTTKPNEPNPGDLNDDVTKGAGNTGKTKEVLKNEPPTPETTEKKVSVNDFFNIKEANDGVTGFIQDMKTPVEKIDPPPGFDIEDPEKDIEPGEEEITETGSLGGSGQFNFTDEHKFTAEFLLIQIDKVLGFAFGMISGEPGDKYRRRKNQVQGKDYEAELAAALVQKYQMKLSLEWAFVSALIIAYSPAGAQAFADRAKNEKLNKPGKARKIK